MDFNRDLWADAYKFYQRQAELLERNWDDLPTFFCTLSQEITRHCSQASPEAKELFQAVYSMIEVRSKQEGTNDVEK